MTRLAIGVVCLAVALVLGLVGQPALGADLHPIVTGLIGIGLVSAAVGVVERRLSTTRNEPFARTRPPER